MKTTSNPLEWKVVQSVNWKDAYAIDQPDPRKSYIADDIDEGDANFIVTAIKQRDTLLKALNDIIASSDEHPYIQNIAKRAVEGLDK